MGIAAWRRITGSGPPLAKYTPADCICAPASLPPTAPKPPRRSKYSSLADIPKNLPSGKVRDEIRDEKFTGLYVVPSVGIDQQIDARRDLGEMRGIAITDRRS